MAYVARQSDFHVHTALERPTEVAPPQPYQGLLRRIFEAVMDARQQRVQREIDRFVAQRGRKMTDSLEREINDRTFRNGWSIHR